MRAPRPWEWLEIGSATQAAVFGGPNFIHPPPTPDNTLLGVGGVSKGGGVKFLPRGVGGQNIHTGQVPGLKKHHLSVRYQAFLEKADTKHLFLKHYLVVWS